MSKVFDYKDTHYKHMLFHSYELIQFDIEKNLNSFLGKSPEKIKTIIIVGAWQGEEVRRFLQFPNAQIFCFEPNPRTFSILKEIYKKETRVHCYPFACASSNGEAIFFETNWEGNGSLLPVAKDSHLKQTEEFSVQTIRLDSMEEFKDRDIDLLWVDVQGFELEVLKGADKILSRIQSCFLEITVNKSIYIGGTILSEIDEHLLRKGISRVAQGMNKIQQDGNALFVRTPFLGENMYHSEEVVNERLNRILKEQFRKRNIKKSWMFKIIRSIMHPKLRRVCKKYVSILNK